LLDSSGIFRIVRDLCFAELSQSRRSAGHNQCEVLDDFRLWGPSTWLLERHLEAGGHCLFLDSLERISITSSINQFFRLHEWGVEDNLLRQKTLGDLAELVAQVLLEDEIPWQRLCLLSSGTTSEAKPTVHSREGLEQEVQSWRQLLPEARRVLSTIPCHHLYGLAWTVLWPTQAGLEIVDVRLWSPGRWRKEMRSGDVIVSFPLLWEQLLKSLDRIPEGVTGISSAGKLPEAVWQKAVDAGLSRMVEVYGSTETGGVAFREQPQVPFRLAPHWLERRSEFTELVPDRIKVLDAEHFYVLDRKDGAVKVAGNLVQFTEVERAIRDFSEVQDCRLRLGPGGAQARLEALIVTAEPSSRYAGLEQEISSHLASRLPAAALPRRFSFVPELPFNGLGKVAGW